MHQETGRGILKLPPHPNRLILSLISTKLIYLILLLVEVNYMIDKPTLDQTLKISAQYGFSFWNSMIVSSALINHCSILYSEDLQHNQIIENRLQIINPFKILQ